MNIIKSIVSITAMITLAAAVIAAESADGAVAKQLEQKTVGYWAAA